MDEAARTATDPEPDVANVLAAWSLAALRVSARSPRAADVDAAAALRVDLDALTLSMSALRPPTEALDALLRALPALDAVPRFASMTDDERAVWCLVLLLDERPGLRAFGCALHGLPFSEQVERLAAVLALPTERIEEALAPDGRLQGRSLVAPQMNPDQVAWVTPGVAPYLVLPPAEWSEGDVLGHCMPLGAPRGRDVFGHLRAESALLAGLVSAARKDGAPANAAIIAPTWMRPRDFVWTSLGGNGVQLCLVESAPADVLDDWDAVSSLSGPASDRVFIVDPPAWSPDALDRLRDQLEAEADAPAHTTVWLLRPDDDPDGRLDGLFDLVVVVSPSPEADRRAALTAMLVDAGLEPEPARTAASRLPPVHLDLAERAIATARRLGIPPADLVQTLETLLRPHAARRPGR